MEDGDEARRDGEVDALALAAFVFSIVSLVVPVVMTAVALLLARRSHQRIAAADDGRRGGQLATAAQVVAATWCALVVAAVATIVTLAALTGDDGDDDARADRIAVASQEELFAALRRQSVERVDPYIEPRTPTSETTEPDDVVTFQGDDRPGPLRFDEDAVVHYSSTGSRLVLTLVGDGERVEIARCAEPCDGTVAVGHLRRAPTSDLEVDADDGWYVRVDGGYEVVD